MYLKDELILKCLAMVLRRIDIFVAIGLTDVMMEQKSTVSILSTLK